MKFFIAILAMTQAAKVKSQTKAHARVETKTGEAPTERMTVQTEWTGMCNDLDGYYGWTDTGYDGCDWYWGMEDTCGWYDDDDFWAFYDCCACGGGCWDGDATDDWGDGCDWYETNPDGCGWYDSADFDSYSECCVCGGMGAAGTWYQADW